jgi:predicted chitinase
MKKNILIVFAIASLGYIFTLFAVNSAQAAACDPTKQSCAPLPECVLRACMSAEDKAKHEKDNNCQFPPCSDTIKEVSSDGLKQIFPSVNAAKLAAIVAEINSNLKNTATQGLINTKRKLAHFLAQIREEVGTSITLEESLNYSVADLSKFSYFRENPDEAELYGRKPAEGNKPAQKANQEAIANRIYANRNGNGNIESGDGWRYKGRGMIQTTGKANYETFTKEHNKIWGGTTDFITSPELLSNEVYAVRAALVFWKTNGLADKADKGVSKVDSDNVTRRVNRYTPTYGKRYDHLTAIMKLESFVECKK